MGRVTEEARSTRAAIAQNRAALMEVLDRYGATAPRLFGSVARGDSGLNSDVDILVDLKPDGRSPLLRVAGIGEEFSHILGVSVDVVTDSLLREPVSVSAHRDAIPL